MITDAQEFKQRLLEIQNDSVVTYTTLPSNEPRFIIDANSREISIPVEFEFLAVLNDHKAETVYFEIDRYFDNQDLSECTCVVQFINENTKFDKSSEGISPVTYIDLETIDGKIIFGWEITNDCAVYGGTIAFAVRFYSIDDDGEFTYSFNTKAASSLILDTLNVYSDSELNQSPNIQVWINKLNALESKINDIQTGTTANVELATVDEAKEFLGM